MYSQSLTQEELIDLQLQNDEQTEEETLGEIEIIDDDVIDVSNSEQEEQIIEKIFTQRISWKQAENALEYKVIIEEIDSDFVKTYVTSQNYIDFSLDAGHYKYKIITLDFLGREANATEYKNFTIVKAQKPSISLQKDMLAFFNSSTLSVPLNVQNFVSGTKVQVINEETQETIKVNLAYRKKENLYVAKFRSLKPGRYYFTAENPSGLIGKSETYDVYEEKKVLCFVKINHLDKNQNLEEDMQELIEDAIPNAGKLFIQASPLIAKAIYPKIVYLQYKEDLFYGAKLLCSYLPIKKGIYNLGVELDGTYKIVNSFTLEGKQNIVELLDFKLYFLQSIVTTYRTAVNIKPGAGLSSISIFVQDREKEKFTYLNAGACVSFMYKPYKYGTIELGLDYEHIFIPKFQWGILQPFIAFGIRF